MIRCLPVVLVVLSLVIGGAAAGQGVSSLNGAPKPAPAQAGADPAKPPPVPEDEAAAVRRQLEEARAEYARSGKAGTAPAAASPAELIEHDYLLGELMAALERHLDIIERRPEATRRAADQEEQTRAWTAPVPPPAVSILAVDHQRDLLEDTRARLRAAIQREGFRDQQIASEEKRLKASEVIIRQQAERIDAAQSEADKNREIWLRDLARLRSRAAAATMAEAQAAKGIDNAEISELRALALMQEWQLAGMRDNSHFTESELASVLADLDRQIATLQTRLVRVQAASAQSHRQLDQAQRRLQAFREANPATVAAIAGGVALRRQTLEREVALRRLQTDTDDLADDTLRRMIEARGWERAGWQWRWHLVTSGTDQDKLRDSLANLSMTLQKMETWQHYLTDELARISQLGDDEGPSLTATRSRADAEDTGALRAAYRQRAAILRDAATQVDAQLHTFRIWQQDLQDRESGKPLMTVAREGWAMVLQSARTVWEFELFAAEDTIEVDGRRITATRSVTVGKSLGVILLVLLGAILSRRLLAMAGAFAATQFNLSRDDTSTVTRWLHIVVVLMLFIIALYVANIPLTVFAFLGGALAIGVGFGTQVILKNMISGIILLVERPLRVGDIVEVGAVSGTVTHINIRSSTVRTSDGIEILVPNSSFIENNVTNWTYSNARVRRSVAVGADYATPPERVSEVLMAVAHKHPAVLDDPGPCVLLDSFGADSINYILRYWIDYAAGADSSKIASELRFMIAADLAAAGISIPFPQRVVHLRRMSDADGPLPPAA